MSLRKALPRVACCLGVLVACAPRMPASASTDALIERFATIETVWAASISPDGKHVALGCSTQQGLRAACVYELDAPGQAPVVYTSAAEQRIDRVFWAQPDWLLLHVNRHDDVTAVSNNLSFVRIDRLLAQNVRTGQRSILLERNAPLEFDLTDIASTPPDWPGAIVMRAPTNYGMGAYRVDLATGKGKLLERYQPSTLTVLFDGHGQPVLEQQYDAKWGRLTLIRREDGIVTPLEAIGPGVDAAPDEQPARWIGFTEGGNKLAGTAYSTDGTFQPLLFDVGSRARMPADPELERVNIDGWIGDVSSDAMVGISYTTDYPQQRFYDEELESARVAVAKALPDQNILFTSWSTDRSLITVRAAPPGVSETFYLFDRKQGSLSPLGRAHPLLDGLPAVTTSRIEYEARDGLKIEAFLTFPAGKAASDGPFPLLLMPHGGPLARDDAGFMWHVNYFAQRGYAVLRPNFRGSDGYGLKFRKQGYGEFGGAMIDDIIDGAHFAIGSGVADRNRICSFGASYGGYAALMVALREPELVKCTVSIAGITDPTAMFGERLKLFHKYSSVMRFWESYIGSRFRAKEQILDASPVRRAREIPVPVLLIHGTDDFNVPVWQSRHLNKELAQRGRPVKLVELRGVDHYFNSTQARRVVLSESDAFLAKYLSSR
ncbi:MAG: prolyl oligopeptidase family serine peptidase [Pseudomonadota bacterium]|nr:prolyl oligopeptidase family serine peptidase [Pseudomonadota bacterium]